MARFAYITRKTEQTAGIKVRVPDDMTEAALLKDQRVLERLCEEMWAEDQFECDSVEWAGDAPPKDPDDPDEDLDLTEEGVTDEQE